ncbi:TonB-dependent receptor [Aequorivita aquimaris]|uniref:TonB-dependent receptor n=1 Tax=Aequorivita aquimaris TaxID=1548749 RepID=A0A137RM31_9FLAO|nr:SusC/RagA family TonB-linked outer membrane protein [Aequorivita aquimaris]KXO01256.1 TonB-dependent receptor [Aequorivita aquimaris]
MKNNYRHSLALALCFALLLSYNSPIFSQNLPQKTISGTITDADGPLSGVNVLVKNTARGSISDLEGRYALTATEKDTLVFTYLGYKTQERVIANNSFLNIVMQLNETSLDQVVINAGYYKISDKEKTGSIARITATEIENQPISNPLAAMQGRLAGVNIIQNTGVPGGGFTVRIRGRNSIRADGSEPLYIVDGVPYPSQSLGSSFVSTVLGAPQSPLNGINPDNIASIEVLKDADATAIYGSRGANGVVLITTKQGTSGKTTLSLNTSTGVGQLTRRMDLLNTQEYLAMRREAFANDGITEYPFNEYDINGTWDQSRYTDWQEELLGHTAYFNDYGLSLTGGNENTRYLLRASHQKQTTVFPGNFNYKKYGALATVTHNAADDRLFVSFTANYVADENDLPTTAFITPALNLAPNAPALYDENGEVNWEDGTFFNPIAQLKAKYLSNSSTLLGSSTISYQLFKGFNLKTNLGYNEIHLEESRTSPNTIYNPAYGLDSSYSSISVNTSSRKSWIVEPQIEYNTQMGDLEIAALVGTTFQNENSNGLLQYAGNFTSNALIYNLASAAEREVLASTDDVYRYNAVYGRLNFNWNKKYILNLTGRRDGSSRFGADTRFANFGAVGAAWLFGEEKFIKENVTFLSFGKIRGSYGTSGNDQIGNYGYLDTYIGSGLSYQGIPTLQPTQLYNPNFGWETNRKLELALELGLFKNSFDISGAYYRNRSSSQLVGIPLPGTTGFPTLTGNLDATVQNTGWEFEFDAKLLNNDNLNWTAKAQLTIPRNELISFPNLESSTYSNRFVIGQPLDIALLYHYSGVDPQTGLYTFQDFDGDGNITSPNDAKQATKVGVDYYGGITNSVSYKNFSLDFLLQYVKQTGYNYLYTSALAGTMANQPTAVLDHWEQPGDGGFTQMYSAGYSDAAYTAYGNLLNSDAVVSDASYLRLRNISLSYNLPIQATLGAKCRLYVLAQNLFTITDFLGMDPETQSLDQLPPLRVINAGLEINI